MERESTCKQIKIQREAKQTHVTQEIDCPHVLRGVLGKSEYHPQLSSTYNTGKPFPKETHYMDIIEDEFRKFAIRGILTST